MPQAPRNAIDLGRPVSQAPQRLFSRGLRRQRQFYRTVLLLRQMITVARFERHEFIDVLADFLDLKRCIDLGVVIQLHGTGPRQHTQCAHGFMARNVEFEPMRLLRSQKHDPGMHDA